VIPHRSKALNHLVHHVEIVYFKILESKNVRQVFWDYFFANTFRRSTLSYTQAPLSIALAVERVFVSWLQGHGDRYKKEMPDEGLGLFPRQSVEIIGILPKAFLLAFLITVHKILDWIFIYCDVLLCWRSGEEGRWNRSIFNRTINCLKQNGDTKPWDFVRLVFLKE